MEACNSEGTSVGQGASGRAFAPAGGVCARPWATVAVLAVALGLNGCASTQPPAADLVELAGWTKGTFDSTEQSAAAPDDFGKTAFGWPRSSASSRGA